MKISLNGKMQDIAAASTVLALLTQLELQRERVAVECNGDILARESFASHELQEGDIVEVVRFVGGG